MSAMTIREAGRRPVGEQLRAWRERRRLSQLDLAIRTDISARHLSFVETGRSRPTATMILRITEQLSVPLRERNALLLAGGYAPAYPQHDLAAPELENARTALRQVLAGHEPYPAVVVDPGAPVNVLRLSLHPNGMAPRIANLSQWRGHLLTQLRHRAEALGDHRLSELHAELAGYPGGADEPRPAEGVVLPLRYRAGDEELAFFSISASVGTATDVTVEELAIDAFCPADEATGAALRRSVFSAGDART